MFFFLNRSVFSYFILTALVVAGLYSIVVIGKESMPEIEVPIVNVQTPFAGAGALDVEELVTNPIEDQLKRALDDVDSITSISQQGISIVTVNFESNVDINIALQEVKDEVDLVVGDLPDDADDPIVSEVSFSDAPVFVVSIAARSAFTQLSETVATIEDALLDVRGVSDVDIAGLPDREISVVLDLSKINEFGLNASDIVNGLSGADASLPVGTIVQNNVEYSVTFDGDLEEVEAIRSSVVGRTQAGEPVYVRDVAIIEDGLAEYTSRSRLSVDGSEPQQAVTFSISKQVGYDVTVLAEDLRATLDELQVELAAENLEFVTLTDSGQDVFDDLISLSSSALQTVLLVFVVLLIGLGLRPATLAALSVPLSFTVAFVGLLYTGNTLNFISLFALVLVIGMLVDAAVVVTEGMSNEIEKGEDGDTAARSTLTEFFGSIVAGTATTIVVFAPMLFLSGTTGQFISSIPATVIIVLLGSLFVALAFVPLIGTKLLRKEPTKDPNSFAARRDRVIHHLSNWYRGILETILDSPKLANRIILAIVGSLVVSISLLVFGLIKFEFFPADDFNQVTVEITMPAGGLLSQAETITEGVEAILHETDHIASFVSNIEADTAEIIVVIEDDRYGDDVLKDLRNTFKAYGDADVTVTPPASGPTTGAPFQLKFIGENQGDLTALAAASTKLLEGIEGTTDISSSVDSNSIDITLLADRAAIEEAGLTVGGLAQIVRTSLFGGIATSLKHPKSDEDVDVVVKVALNPMTYSVRDTNIITIDTLRTLPIQTAQGTILLGSFMNEDIIESAAKIEHDDGDRVVTVSSYLEEGVVVSDINNSFLALAESELDIPDCVTMEFGGDTEESAESSAELGIALLIGILLIIAVLIFQFNSVKKTVFVISVIPFGLVGVLFGLFLFNQTLSFTAMVGFVALVGIVINNSIILIDVMSDLEKKYTSRKSIVVEGSASRLRPILLTTTTTVIGMIPLLFTSPMWTPLALAIIFGLLFAVVLTLLLIPILYYRWGSN